MKTCIRIALNCVEADWNKRPSIRDIIHTLNESETVIEKQSLGNALPSVNLQRSMLREDWLNNIDPDLTVRKELKLMVVSGDQSEKVVGSEVRLTAR